MMNAITSHRDLYIDQLSSGFLAWTPHTKAYKAVPAGSPPLSWETESQPALETITALIDQDDYFDKLAVLWGQESGRTTGNPELRPDNILFIKTLGSLCFSDCTCLLRALTILCSQDIPRCRT